MRWTAFIVAAWSILFAVSAIHASLPASWWFDAAEIQIAPQNDGACPPMAFDRTIERPFYGEWVVTILRETSSIQEGIKLLAGPHLYRLQVTDNKNNVELPRVR